MIEERRQELVYDFIDQRKSINALRDEIAQHFNQVAHIHTMTTTEDVEAIAAQVAQSTVAAVINAAATEEGRPPNVTGRGNQQIGDDGQGPSQPPMNISHAPPQHYSAEPQAATMHQGEQMETRRGGLPIFGYQPFDPFSMVGSYESVEQRELGSSSVPQRRMGGGSPPQGPPDDDGNDGRGPPRGPPRGPQDLPGHRPDHQVGRMEGRRVGRQRPGRTSHNKTDYLQFFVNCNYHHTIREKGLRA